MNRYGITDSGRDRAGMDHIELSVVVAHVQVDIVNFDPNQR